MRGTLTPSRRRIIPNLADFNAGVLCTQSNRAPPRQRARLGAMSANASFPRDPLAQFAHASLPRALWQLANTLPPFLALLTAMAWSRLAGWSYVWTVLLA